jgi:RNA polymerase subunit RPABC4/transcription elongation factor Spt4
MATFSMVCRECRHKFTVECDRFLTDEARVCPQCSSPRTRQRLSGLLRQLDVGANDGEKLRPKKCA